MITCKIKHFTTFLHQRLKLTALKHFCKMFYFTCNHFLSHMIPRTADATSCWPVAVVDRSTTGKKVLWRSELIITSAADAAAAAVYCRYPTTLSQCLRSDWAITDNSMGAITVTSIVVEPHTYLCAGGIKPNKNCVNVCQSNCRPINDAIASSNLCYIKYFTLFVLI